MSEVTNKMNAALDTVVFESENKQHEIKSLSLGEFTVEPVFPLDQSVFVGLIHKSTPVSDITLADSQLAIEVENARDFDNLLYSVLRALVYKETNTTEHDPHLDSLIERGIVNSKITTANLAKTIIQLS